MQNAKGAVRDSGVAFVGESRDSGAGRTRRTFCILPSAFGISQFAICLS
jgi:hypothetical protein